MRAKVVLLTLLSVAAIGGASFGIHLWRASQSPIYCQMCDRKISAQTVFRIETAGGTIFACCPRCAMHHLINHPGEARKALATDLDTGRLIAAQAAYYDVGGEIQYCTRNNSPVERTPAGVQMRTYDRCLPVMVAFASRSEAEAYRAHHGGRVITYDEALQEVAGSSHDEPPQAP